jgi:hypothetical protein
LKDFGEVAERPKAPVYKTAFSYSWFLGEAQLHDDYPENKGLT